MVARDMIPAGCDISPVNGPSLITIDKSSCKIIGVATLAINLFIVTEGAEGIRPAVDDPKIPFLITAFIVESLAFPVILGHDFLKYFQLDIMYSEKPVRIIGRNTKAGPPGIPWLMRDALDAVDRGVRSRRCCQNGSAASYGSPSVLSSPPSMMEPESPRMALMAAQRREVLKTTGRLVTQGVQTADPEEEKMVTGMATQETTVTGMVTSGSQTEEILVENKVYTETLEDAALEDEPDADMSRDKAPLPVRNECERPCPEEEREVDLAREAEHYCVGCAAAFAHLDASNFDRPCDICSAPTGCAGLRADGPLMTNEELEKANLKLPAELQARVPSTSKPGGKELIEGEEWPPADWEHVDGFEGDDICQDPLRFAVPEFLDETVKLPDICESPTEEQKPVANLCEEFKDLFVLRPGRCNQAEHSVETGTAPPICERIRPIPHKYREEISVLLKEMEELGVIRRSTSAWRFPCVFVPKKNGKVRMCIDYRNLNKACHTEAYPVPRPDDVQEHLAGAQVFSTLDLRSGYWQIPVRKEDQRKTAFCPGPGFPLYEWVMMPFGLASAPATFQRLMDAILGHLPFVRVYLDDVLIFSRSTEEHLEHLRIVFELLRAAGMTVAAEKCEFMEDRVTYLGHMFDSTGMSPDLGKVEVILRWPMPRTAPALRSFLGLAGYYRNFVPHFADRSRCLYEAVNFCTKNKMVELGTQWGKAEELAFNDLKQWIASLPLLAYPDFSRPFQLMTDASDVAIGAVLEQDGRPLAFFSQSLTSTQKVWPVYEREAYAIFKALERFRPLLWGYHLELVVFSDHKPLEWIQTATTPKVQRWLISMSQFKFKVFYKKGKHNVVADALSRVTLSDDEMVGPDLSALQQELQRAPASDPEKLLTKETGGDPPQQEDPAPACVLTLCERWSTADLVHEQEADEVLRVVRDRVRREEPLSKDELKEPEFRPYRRVWLTLMVHGSGLLVRKVWINEEVTSRFVPVIPERLRGQALDRFHEEAGHFRREHMVAKLRRTAYWPGMSKDISEYLLHCEGCAPHKNVALPHLPYVPYPVGSPWHTVAIDFLTVAPTRSGVSKLLVVVDHFTRWAEAVPVAGESAAEALKALLYVFSIHGPPARVLSDQGSAFEAQLFRDVLAQLGVAKSRTSVYHPNANGHVERFNSTILNLLRTHVTRVDAWQDHLRSVLWAYNTTPHSVTGYAPFFLMYGREPPTLFFPALEPYVDYVFDPQGYQRHLSRIRACIEDNVDEWVTAHGAGFQALKEKEKVTAMRRHFVGQRVRLRVRHPNNLPGRKLLPKWQLDWYIAKFVPGTHLKTVVLRHYPSREEKVISTDYIVPDPVQPADVPVELGIVRLDPPAEEGPHIEQFPFRDELVRSVGSRRSAGSSGFPEAAAPVEPRLVDVPYVYGGDDVDPLAERRDDLLPRQEAPSSDSAQANAFELEAPIPVPVHLGFASSAPSVTSRAVPQASGRSAPAVTPVGVAPAVPESFADSPLSRTDSTAGKEGGHARSLPFTGSTPTHTVSAPAADFQQLLGHSVPSARQAVSAPSALARAESQQLSTGPAFVAGSEEPMSSSSGSGPPPDVLTVRDPSGNVFRLTTSSSNSRSSATEETPPSTPSPVPASTADVLAESMPTDSLASFVTPDEIPSTPALESPPAAAETPAVSARSGGSVMSARSYADVVTSTPEQVEEPVLPRRSLRTPRAPTRFSPGRYTSRGGYVE